jgi:hypothetical protein
MSAEKNTNLDELDALRLAEELERVHDSVLAQRAASIIRAQQERIEKLYGLVDAAASCLRSLDDGPPNSGHVMAESILEDAVAALTEEK